MIDFSKLVKEIMLIHEVYLCQNNSFEMFGLIFDPVIKNGEVRKYVSFYRGLRLTIIGQELIIQNSLCKFYHGYNNVNFNFTELLHTKTLLEEQLGLSLDDAVVRNFEYGVVISVAKPSLVYNSLGMYKNCEPQHMTYNGTIYGVCFVNTTHSVKIYDKTLEAKRNGYKSDYGLLRIEKKVKLSHLNSSPRFKDNQVNTFGDLCKRNTFQLLADDLVLSLIKIELNDIAYYTNNLTIKDLRLLGYMQHYPIRKLVKEHNTKSYESDMKRYREILSDRTEDNQAKFIQKVIEVTENVIIN